MIRALAFLLVVTSSIIAYADPAGISVGGTVQHGQSITISGTGFGTKTAADPVVWDNCDHGQAVTARWSGGWPTAADQAASTPRYAASGSIGSVATAHSLASNYLAARAYDSGSGQGFPNNPGVWRVFSSAPTTIYASWYQRVHPGFSSGDNFKWLDYSGGNSPYDSSGNWYLEYVGGLGGNNHINDNAAGLFQDPDLCGGNWGRDYLCNSWYFGDSVNPTSQWVKLEVLINVSSSDTAGWIDLYENGSLERNGTGPHSYNGATDQTISGTPRNLLLGGFSRNSGVDNWRFWNDLYVDTSFSRVMICTGSTWANHGTCEPQIPTTWSDTSITATVNRAAFGATDSRYLYVVDSSNVANSSGVAITFGDESPTPTPTATPTPEPDECDGAHLVLCVTEGSCTGAGGYWCGGTCQSGPCATPTPTPTPAPGTHPNCFGCRVLN